MLDITSNQVVAVASLGLFLVALLQLINRLRKSKNTVPSISGRLKVYTSQEFPRIHATNGVPTLEQLTQDLEVNPKHRLGMQLLYEMGLTQFNHYMNNRDGVINESRREMKMLSELISDSEAASAQGVGVKLATVGNENMQETLAEYDSLKPETKLYAQHKRREHEALQTIANDLSKGVPRTDYTSVKSLIELGGTSLSAILSDLPLPWQELRTIDQRKRRRTSAVKPPKREFVHTIFLMRDRTILEDKRAEKDGKWLRSYKHSMLVPYQDPSQILQTTDAGGPSVARRKSMVIIDRNPSPEWITEFYRQGGYLDQQFILARDGRTPEQLRRAYRQRQITMLLWVIASALLVVNAFTFATRFL